MAQIDIELAKLKETKASIAQSITAKGGVLTDPSDFSSYSVAVDNLPTTVTDFAVIGYDSVPEPFNSGIEYAKQIMNTWDNPTYKSYANDLNLYFFPIVDTSNLNNMSFMFNATNIMCIPEINVSNVTAYSQCFWACNKMAIADLSSWDTSKAETMTGMFGESYIKQIILPKNFGCANMSSIFSNCNELADINWENLDLSKATHLDSAFYGCDGLTIIPELNTSNCTNIDNIFGYANSIHRIEGLDVRSVTSDIVINSSTSNKIEYMVLKNFGANSSKTTFNLNAYRKWGINTDQNPDARQSLIDSLITYSVDRTGMNAATIKLYSSVKALLTSDEIAQIEAKNYTVS